MDLASIIGLVGGAAIVVIVMILDGGSPAELFAVPQAILLIFGGALAATAITTSMEVVVSLPKVIASAFTVLKLDGPASIELLVSMAERARKEGLLSLEEPVKKVEDEFVQRGLMMVVDGIDAVQIRAVMETYIDQVRSQRRLGYSFFMAAGGFAPTFGIIGTVMGLISVLKQLDDPSKLAKSIASAFLATLWGLLSSNLIFLPIGAKLKAKSDEETHIRVMQLEGVLSILAGENPRIVRDKLTSYLPPAHKAKGAKGAVAEGQQQVTDEAGA
jgi:chemotaxis protein MotA